MRPRRLRRAMPNIARIAGRASGLAIASAQTVGHRSALMTQAFDEAEITRMWTEKMQAAAEIWTAAAFRLPAAQIMWLGLIWDQTARVARTAATCRSPA